MTRPPEAAAWATAILVAIGTTVAHASGQQTATAERQPAATVQTHARTPDGHPDLQGVWSFATLTPLERPDELGDKAVLSASEAAEFERKTRQRNNVDTAERRPDSTGTYNEFWWDRGDSIVGTRRTSLIVDPSTGKLPKLTAETEKKALAFAATLRQPANGPEDWSLSERCIVGFTNGTPIAPGGYNQNLQIVQSSDHLVIMFEMIHDARIVPLDGRPHLGANLQQWLGDPRGRWEGGTLVVETTNFVDTTNATVIGARRGSSDRMRLLERFTRVDPDTLVYQFTVDDPKTYTKIWSAEIPMTRSRDGRLYEYACHEGNYGLFGILSGARAEEKSTEGATQGSR